MSTPTITLNTETKIPQLGFGTWMLKDEKECTTAVKAALDSGYRHFDTAQIYENEQFVGRALQDSNIDRADFFLTTKIWNENMFWDDLMPSFEESLKRLRTDYVDLLLLHFPVTELRRPAWRRMEDIYRSGRAKSIGVSNYTIKHLEELLDECKVKPAVNQVELHIFLQQPELVDYCKKNDIAIAAYSPLAHGYDMRNELVAKISLKHKKSPAQVMIRWCLDKGFITIPKSANPERIRENFETLEFNLDDQDMNELESLSMNLRTCWDPTNVS